MFHPQRRVLSGLEREWPAWIHPYRPQVFRYVAPFEDSRDVVLVRRRSFGRQRHARPSLFIRERHHWIVTRRSKCRIRSAERRANQSESDGLENPLPGDQNHQAGTRLLQNRLREKGQRNAQSATQESQDQRLAE